MSLIKGAMLAAALLVAGSARAQEEVTLLCKARPTKGHPNLRLEGTVPFPDGMVFNITLHRLEEEAISGHLTAGATPGACAKREVKGRKIQFDDLPASGPGLYGAVLELAEEDQALSKVEAVRALSRRKWEFQFAAWGDDLASDLGPRLGEVDDLAEETLKFIQRFEAAAASSAGWQEGKGPLAKEMGGLRQRLGRTEALKLYPAAVKALGTAVQGLQSTGPRIAFTNDGKLTFEFRDSDRKAEGSMKNFSFDEFRKQVEGAVALAGREFALWVVKDARRSEAGAMRSALLSAVKDHAKHPGVSAFAERLEKIQPEDLDPLEKEIRGE